MWSHSSSNMAIRRELERKGSTESCVTMSPSHLMDVTAKECSSWENERDCAENLSSRPQNARQPKGDCSSSCLQYTANHSHCGVVWHRQPVKCKSSSPLRNIGKTGCCQWKLEKIMFLAKGILQCCQTIVTSHEKRWVGVCPVTHQT